MTRALMLLVLVVVGGCDSAADVQRYTFMITQFQNVADQAERGEPVLQGSWLIVENDCKQAERDRATIRAARPLAEACTRSLQTIRARVAH